MKIKTITLGILTIILSSCASIIHGPTQKIEVSSQPSGARIMIDGQDYGTTPRSISLRRKGREKDDKSKKQSYDVRIALEGYAPYKLKLTRRVDGWFWGNLLFGGIIGIIIDASNGSMYKLSPNQITAQMKSNSTGMIKMDDDQVYIAVTMEIDKEWEVIGQLNPTE